MNQEIEDLRALPDAYSVTYGKPGAWHSGINRAKVDPQTGQERPRAVFMDQPGGTVIKSVMQ